jgi:dienelactone hydrolase
MRYCVLAGLSLLCLASPVFILPSASSEKPMTAAAETPRTLDTHHLFSPPVTKSAWEARKQELRHQILFSAGLWPMPEKTPLNPLFTGKIEGPDYIIENVAIETRPGFFLCGNLYRPTGKKGPFPAIANPHGHWSNGRLEMQPDVPKADPNGKMGEGRGNLVAIGVNLARQGHVVFAYDMAGYNDTSQASHKFAGNLQSWMWGVSLFGLQTWNSIRVVDFLESLPYVDKKRIGATGASGGGTQTFILSAIDDRVKVAVPVNMISASMQGGCLCENGPGLRVGTDNVEVGAMFAPKPLLLVAATGDWTKNNPTEEWPAIKRVYELYGAGDKTAVKQFNYQHNYNVESREAMYAWFGKWFLKDDNAEHFRERPFDVDLKAMRVWNTSHPMPSSAMKEGVLSLDMKEAAEKRLASYWPTDRSSLRRFQATMRPVLMTSLSIPARDAAGYAAATGASVQSLTRRHPANGSMVLIVTRNGDA